MFQGVLELGVDISPHFGFGVVLFKFLENSLNFSKSEGTH